MDANIFGPSGNLNPIVNRVVVEGKDELYLLNQSVNG